MHKLSMAQALGIWEELVAAYYGKNGFGTDTAEIYLYRLMPCDPSAEPYGPFSTTPSGSEARYKRLVIANQSLVYAERAAQYLTRIVADHRVHLQVRHILLPARGAERCLEAFSP